MSDVAVESAPQMVNLNELLGMSDEDIEAVGEMEEALSDEVLEIEEIDEPHITLSTKKVLEVLKVSALISASGENSFEGKVMTFDVGKDTQKFWLSDNKRNIEKDMNVLNEDNRFEAFLALPTISLLRLIKMCDDTFTIIERVVEDKKQYVLKVQGGEIHIDNIKMSREKFAKDLSDSSTQQFSKVNIVGSIDKLFSFASLTIKSGKGIDFLGNTIQAVPMNSIAKINFDESYPTFRIPLSDAKILYMLSLSDDSDNIGINSTGSIFSGNTFKFKTEVFQTSNCVFDSVAERMFNGEYATIDVKHLQKISELSMGLEASTGDLEFNYNDEGRVVCTLMTKRENSNIVIQGTVNGDLSPMEFPVKVPSSNLKGALSVFKSETMLNMRVSSDGVSMQSGNVKVSVLGKGVGSKK